MSFITTTMLADHMRLPRVSANLQEAIDTAESLAQRYVGGDPHSGKPFVSRSVSLTVYPDWDSKLILVDSGPIFSLTSLEVDDAVVALADVKVGLWSIRYLKPADWFDAESKVEVVYQAGYDTIEEMPADLVQGILKLAATLYNRPDTAVLSRNFGSNSEGFTPEAIPPAIRTMLDPFRRMET